MDERSEWIKDLKRDSDKEVQSRELSEQARLRDDELIKAKSPAFWSHVVSCVKKDCDDLNAEFANDDKRKVQLEISTDEFIITNCVRPAKSIQAKINYTLLFAEVQIRMRESIETRPQIYRREIEFRLNSERDLYLRYEGKRFITPEELAGRLIKEVIGLA